MHYTHIAQPMTRTTHVNIAPAYLAIMLLSLLASQLELPPPFPLLKGGDGLPKIESLEWGGVQNFLLERGDKPEKGD